MTGPKKRKFVYGDPLDPAGSKARRHETIMRRAGVQGLVMLAYWRGEWQPLLDYLNNLEDPMPAEDVKELAGLLERCRRSGRPRGSTDAESAALHWARYLLSIGKRARRDKYGRVTKAAEAQLTNCVIEHAQPIFPIDAQALRDFGVKPNRKVIEDFEKAYPEAKAAILRLALQ